MGMRTYDGAGWINRHPWFTLIAVNLTLLCVVLALFELYLRLTVTYSIDYYTGTSGAGERIEYPYGTIFRNSLGFADQEFDLASTKPRIGYFGDSVTYGVGAGYPYRVTELVEAAAPAFEHWNLGKGVGGKFDRGLFLEMVDRFDLAWVVYLLNMNDIHPPADAPEISSSERLVRWIGRQVYMRLDFLRSRSYLYNFVRLKVKNTLQGLGFQPRGYYAYELWPEANKSVFEGFVAEVNALGHDLARRGVGFCIILLPYEMQVSQEAARIYREMGFRWEEGFESGRTQRRLAELVRAAEIYDPLPAFDPATTRIGEMFVYDRGDKIDWNHPNRAGHATIASGFVDAKACSFLREPEDWPSTATRSAGSGS
jgi:hypothetical protein